MQHVSNSHYPTTLSTSTRPIMNSSVIGPTAISIFYSPCSMAYGSCRMIWHCILLYIVFSIVFMTNWADGFVIVDI